MTLPDAVIVERCLNDQKNEFAELVRRHQDSVYNLAFRMTNNPAEADDLTQETFIQAYRKLGTYKSEYLFRNWVMGICVNLTKNRFRSIVRRSRIEQTHVELQCLSDGKKDPLIEALERGIRKLPESLRIPLILKHIEGYSYKDIAGLLKIGSSAAKMRVKRGRDRLFELLNSEMEGELT